MRRVWRGRGRVALLRDAPNFGAERASVTGESVAGVSNRTEAKPDVTINELRQCDETTTT